MFSGNGSTAKPLRPGNSTSSGEAENQILSDPEILRHILPERHE